VAVAWCHHWHCHCIAAATACNFIACHTTALAAALCIVLWHFLPCKGMPRHCSLSHGIVLCSAALHAMPWPCSLYCGIALCATVFCIMPWCYALWCSIMHHVAWAFCFVPQTLRFMLQHWQWHCVSITAPHIQPLHSLLSLKKWRNNQPAALVKVFIGGILMLFNTTLKIIKINLCHWGECFSGGGPSMCQKQF